MVRDERFPALPPLLADILSARLIVITVRTVAAFTASSGVDSTSDNPVYTCHRLSLLPDNHLLFSVIAFENIKFLPVLQQIRAYYIAWLDIIQAIF